MADIIYEQGELDRVLVPKAQSVYMRREGCGEFIIEVVQEDGPSIQVELRARPFDVAHLEGDAIYVSPVQPPGPACKDNMGK